MFAALWRKRLLDSVPRVAAFGSVLRRAPPVAAPLDWVSLRQLTDAYKKLSKAKLSAFVVFSAATGFAAASNEQLEWRKLGATVVGTFGATACANALNQIYEREKDALMQRTRLRPLPLGRLSILHALAFAAVSGSVGVGLLLHNTNALAAGLAAGNIVLYAGVYTPLKQLTYLNTWVGAVVGAIPPLIGWTAATGSMDPGACLLFAALYFWQIPHFLALAWTYKADYAAAGFRMMSLGDATGGRVAACAFRNCLYLLPLSFLATHCNVTTSWFSYEGFVMTVGLALSASAFYSKPSKLFSRALFKASILYLPLFLVAFIFHRRPQSEHRSWSELKEDANRRHRFFTEASRLSTELQPTATAPLYAPFPFAPLPVAAPPTTFLWAGLDDVIQEVVPKAMPSR